MDNFQENLNLVSQHYQKKFKDTGKPEYDIAQFNLLRSNANSFKDFITHHTPKENEPPKGIVFYSGLHSTAAFITHDNKIIAFNLSLSIDAHNVNKIINFTIESSLNTEIHLCQINFGEEKNELQKDDVSCTLFAFKSLKLMCQNDYELFHKMEKSPRYNNTYILPPEILRYAQSDNVVEKCINEYSKVLNLSEDDKQKITQEITGYRSEKYGKFHMLYHQLKHYTGNKEKQDEMIETLGTLTKELETENLQKQKVSDIQE